MTTQIKQVNIYKERPALGPIENLLLIRDNPKLLKEWLGLANQLKEMHLAYQGVLKDYPYKTSCEQNLSFRDDVSLDELVRKAQDKIHLPLDEILLTYIDLMSDEDDEYTTVTITHKNKQLIEIEFGVAILNYNSRVDQYHALKLKEQEVYAKLQSYLTERILG